MIRDSSIAIIPLNTLLLIPTIYIPLPALLSDHLAASMEMFQYEYIYSHLSLPARHVNKPSSSSPRLLSHFETKPLPASSRRRVRPWCILPTYNTYERIDHEFKVWITPLSDITETTTSVTISEQTRSRPRSCIPTNCNSQPGPSFYLPTEITEVPLSARCLSTQLHYVGTTYWLFGPSTSTHDSETW